MNEIDMLKDTTEKLKRDLWSLTNETLSGIDLSQLSSQLSSISTSITNLDTRLDAVESQLTPETPVVLFDKDSASSATNLGFTDGWLPDNSITYATLSSFKYLKIYLTSGDSESVLTVRVPSAGEADGFVVSHMFPQNSRGYVAIVLTFAQDLGSIEFSDMAYFYFTGTSAAVARITWYDTDLPAHGFIRKVEGFTK